MHSTIFQLQYSEFRQWKPPSWVISKFLFALAKMQNGLFSGSLFLSFWVHSAPVHACIIWYPDSTRTAAPSFSISGTCYPPSSSAMRSQPLTVDSSQPLIALFNLSDANSFATASLVVDEIFLTVALCILRLVCILCPDNIELLWAREKDFAATDFAKDLCI